MKKLLATALVAGAMFAVIPARADDPAPVRGTILAPTAILGRAQRCASTTAKGTQVESGVFGVTIPVTAGFNFALKADAGATADFDLAFLNGPPASCEANANAVAVQWVTHNAPVDDTNDEIGVVPADAQYAIINMFEGVPNSAFVYTETEF
jgi:hypothetical protein